MVNETCSDLQVDALGVLSGVRVRARSHCSSSSSSSSSVGPPSAAGTRTTPISDSWTNHRAGNGRRLLTVLTFDVHLSSYLHGGRQVPHLDAAITVTTEQVAAGPRADPTGALALVDHEGRDGGPIHRAHLTHPETHTLIVKSIHEPHCESSNLFLSDYRTREGSVGGGMMGTEKEEKHAG